MGGRVALQAGSVYVTLLSIGLDDILAGWVTNEELGGQELLVLRQGFRPTGHLSSYIVPDS